MAVLEAIGIWLLVSAAFTPLIGYFLSNTPENLKEKNSMPVFGHADFFDLHGSPTPKA